ncbi:kinesin-domain-containing protein [Exidia glandulosa HHB12029]|uniref:Kinesin-like protein n=1 Tax=Exidia glandulosa HHB12029 TaxID=1314781 RepID=A0A165QTK3_EXIGL|nr:kinesin-domain-containing protein [Exidia glandulosa HHB12029]
MDDSSSITIAVRVRPPTAWEHDRLPEPESYEHSFRGDGHLAAPRRVLGNAPLKEVVTVMDEKVLVFDKADENYEQRGYFPPGTKRAKNRRFIFDRVFDPNSRQVDVFESTARPLLDGLLDGFNATVFAYGATGCGKTHTISGTTEDPGIIYLTMAELFQRIDDRKEDMIVEVAVTFLEIYNEEIYDLLADDATARAKGGLAIREDKTVKVVGLTELAPKHADEVKEIVMAGNARRTQSPTHANETSSRSHAVLQIHVTQTPRTASTTELRTMATLSIIDLAGSERASATKNMGQRMIEGANINKSLLALGNCINALCESGTRSRHIPYRNSKLTRLLKFSLGGNCKTVMIVCIAPTSQHFEDTLNTLQYADRAKMIRTKVSRNIINVDRHVAQYVEAINRLNEEVKELKAKLAGKLGQEAEIAKRKAAEAKAEVQRAKTDMHTKTEQVRSAILAAGTCEGNLSYAQAQLHAVNLRVAQIDAMGPADELSADLKAERGLLRAMVVANEPLVASDSTLRQSMQKATNANSMFDAMLRAVSERKLDRLDDVSMDNIRLDSKAQRAEMDKAKAEAERDALRQAVGQQAQLVTNLVGVLARCTVMMQDGSAMLASLAEEPTESWQGIARTVSSSLGAVARSNDQTFSTLLGHSTASFVSSGSSSLTSFSGHATAVSVAPVPVVRNKTRRTSHSMAGSPLRKRASVSARVSVVPRVSIVPAARKEKKTLRWKDEAGEGKLTEGNSVVLDTSASVDRSKNITPDSDEWEDEKTDDSFANGSLGSTSREQAILPGKRRSSRMDPSYLKAKRQLTLGSLAEDDEGSTFRKASPFTDRLNHLPTPPDELGNKMSVKQRIARFDDNTPPSDTSNELRSSKNGRRRSGLGPVRSEKSRRRSSMLPVPSPPSGSHAGPRRILVPATVKSPAKRKRLSLLGAVRHSMPLGKSVGADASMDLSMRGMGSKPTWR